MESLYPSYLEETPRRRYEDAYGHDHGMYRDARKLEGDVRRTWQNVGNHLRRAMEKVKEELDYLDEPP